jgi:hypothetical protein
LGALTDIDPARVSAQKAPSCKQVYVIAHLALEALGHDWPDSRRQASELIRELEVEPLERALAGTPSAWLEPS